jgi:hypothetical protein
MDKPVFTTDGVGHIDVIQACPSGEGNTVPVGKPEVHGEDLLTAADLRRQILAECSDMCREMAIRYDDDIEGCTAEELIRYSEGMSCALRLADIFKKDEMHKWLDGGEVVN